MTPAERQARRRAKLKHEEKERAYREGGYVRQHRTPHGYNEDKQRMQAEGHEFVRVPKDWEDEFGGVFVDGAWMKAIDVITLAKLPLPERKAQIAEARSVTKQIAIDAVRDHMKRLQVSVEELV
jgi:hypothetical protein